MHFPDNTSRIQELRGPAQIQAARGLKIPDATPAPTMDHLDALEAQSIYIFREAFARLKKLAGRRWTNEGAIVIQADETRSQARNRELARERLVEMIAAALVVPKRRIKTKPTYGSVQRRLVGKKVRSAVKEGRQAPEDDE